MFFGFVVLLRKRLGAAPTVCVVFIVLLYRRYKEKEFSESVSRLKTLFYILLNYLATSSIT